MDDLTRVSMSECISNLNAIPQHLVRGQRATMRDVAHRPAFHELHGDVGRTVCLADFMNRADGGMAQSRGGTGFAHETAARDGVFERVSGQELEGDVAVEPLVVSAIDHTHATSTKLLEYAIVAELLAGHRSTSTVSRWPS